MTANALGRSLALPAWTPPGSAGRPGLMVVDDEEQVLESIRSVIEAMMPDRPAWFFTDPMDAVDAFDSGSIDVGLLVTDFKMFHMNGFELIDALRRRRPDLPAFMITAYNDPMVLGLRAEALQVPMMAKPFGVEEFMHLVRQTLPKP